MDYKIALQKFNMGVVPFGAVLGDIILNGDEEISNQAAQLLADCAALRIELERKAGLKPKSAEAAGFNIPLED